MIIDTLELTGYNKTLEQLKSSVNNGDYDFILEHRPFLYITEDVGIVRVNQDKTVVASRENNVYSTKSLMLDEVAPKDTVSSLCNFKIEGNTVRAYYSLNSDKFKDGEELHGKEVPLITTKGTLSVVSSEGKTKYNKYIGPLLSNRGIMDTVTHEGITRYWSEKFYINKQPLSVIRESDYITSNNVKAIWEFTVDEFNILGIPAKLDNIPIISSCFYDQEDAEAHLNNTVNYTQPYPAVFSYDEDVHKYILTVRGINENMYEQTTKLSKAYFHYKLAKEVVDNESLFALNINAGDVVSFTADYMDNQLFIDNSVYVTGEGSTLGSYSSVPDVKIEVPLNTYTAASGMSNVANILNVVDTGKITVLGGISSDVISILPTQLTTNTAYNLGVIDSLNLSLPVEAKIGDQIRVDFICGDNVTSITITPKVAITDNILAPAANSIYSMYFDYGLVKENTLGWRLRYQQYKYMEV